MRRVLLIFGLLACGCFQLSLAIAQDTRVEIRLFAVAEFPFFADEDYRVRYPTIYEYKVFSEWHDDPYERDRAPASFDLVAVIVNRGAVPAESIELELIGDRKIGESWDFEFQPHPREIAVWEGSNQLGTMKLGSLDPRTVATWRLGSFLMRDLKDDLTVQDLWPWELRYEVTLQCANCIDLPRSNVSISMFHSH